LIGPFDSVTGGRAEHPRFGLRFAIHKLQENEDLVVHGSVKIGQLHKASKILEPPELIQNRRGERKEKKRKGRTTPEADGKGSFSTDATFAMWYEKSKTLNLETCPRR